MDRHSPTPWRLHGQTIRDAEGVVVVSAMNPCGMADREMIVEAVNCLADAIALADDCARAAAAEHSTRARAVEDAQREANVRADRLRDLVRRLADNLRRYHILGDRDNALLREAREALGEAAP